MKSVLHLLLLSSIFLLISCDTFLPLNDNPPNYIRNVAVEKDVASLTAYFVLCDANAQMTTADGLISISVFENTGQSSDKAIGKTVSETELYSDSYGISKNDFRRARVGNGAAEHDVIIYPISRITYESFRKRPSESSGKIRVSFLTRSGRILRGENTIIF